MTASIIANKFNFVLSLNLILPPEILHLTGASFGRHTFELSSA
jgi:hypothetical protein